MAAQESVLNFFFKSKAENCSMDLYSDLFSSHIPK